MSLSTIDRKKVGSHITIVHAATNGHILHERRKRRKQRKRRIWVHPLLNVERRFLFGQYDQFMVELRLEDPAAF